MSYHGKFKPQNPKKYVGDPANIIYRSGLELRFMGYLDTHPGVLSWASEESMCVIPYVSPLDKKVHRYFCDFFVEIRARDNTTRKRLVEVKPKNQCMLPVKPKKYTKKAMVRYLSECRTFAINTAKWKAAEAACEVRGWDWLILTDQALKW